jgi:hypothetical protein
MWVDLERVAEQVRDRALDPVAVDEGRGRLPADLEVDRDVRPGGASAHGLDDLGHDLVYGDGAALELHRAGVDPGELEQVVDHAVEALDVAANGDEVALRIGGLGHDSVLRRVDHGADGRERGTEVCEMAAVSSRRSWSRALRSS